MTTATQVTQLPTTLPDIRDVALDVISLARYEDKLRFVVRYAPDLFIDSCIDSLGSHQIDADGNFLRNILIDEMSIDFAIAMIGNGSVDKYDTGGLYTDALTDAANARIDALFGRNQSKSQE